MPKLVVLHCPNCRARLPAVQRGQLVIHCDYCNTDSNVSHTLHMPAAPLPAPASAPSAPSSRQPTRPSCAAPLAVGMFAAIALVLGSVMMLARSSTQRVAPTATRYEYWSAAHNPVVTDLDGDGTADVLGIYRDTVIGGGEVVGGERIGAYAGGTNRRLWQSDDLGGNAQLRRFALVGDAVVVTTGDHDQVSVLDRRTGAVRHRLAVTDRVKQLCVVDATHAWLDVIDDQSVTLDVGAGTVVRAPRPAACPTAEWEQCSSWTSADNHQTPQAQCVPASDRRALAPDGMSLMYAMRDGNDGIALGHRSKGTVFAHLIAFDPAALAPPPPPPPSRRGAPKPPVAPRPDPVRWVRPVNPDAATVRSTGIGMLGLEVAHGMVVIGYSRGINQPRVQCSDAATGVVRWDVASSTGAGAQPPLRLVITPERIYIVHRQRIDILDAATGTLVGTLGTE